MVKRLSTQDQNQNKLTNVPAPINDGDAANKKYVDDNASGGLTPEVVTGSSKTATVDMVYLANNSTLTTITLPTTAPIGSVIGVMGINATGGWKVVPASGDNILFNGRSVTSSGHLSGRQRDVIYLRCTVANTTWIAESSFGSVTDDDDSIVVNTTTVSVVEPQNPRYGDIWIDIG